MHTMRKRGMTSLEIAQMKAIAKKQTDAMMKESVEEAFLYMLAIPLNVLVDYGMITKDNSEEYISDVISLYESVEKDIVSKQQLADLLQEYAGLDVAATWLKKKKSEGVENGK